MKLRFRALSLLILALLLLSALSSGPASGAAAQAGANDAVDFVASAARSIMFLQDDPDLLYNLGNPFINLESEPLFRPYFGILYFEGTPDPEDPDLVHYTCQVPGCVGQAYGAAFGCYFLQADNYSRMVSLEGTIRVVRDTDGKRRIDVSDPFSPNAFTLYAAFRYPDRSFFQYNGQEISDTAIRGDLQFSISRLLNISSYLYARALGTDQETYTSEVVLPELEKFSDNFTEKISSARNKNGYVLKYYWSLTPVRIGIFALGGALVAFVLFLILRSVIRGKKEADAKQRKSAFPSVRSCLSQIAPDADKARLRELQARAKKKKYLKLADASRYELARLSWPEDREMLAWQVQRRTNRIGPAVVKNLPWPDAEELLRTVALKGSDEDARLAALESLPYPEERDTLRIVATEDTSDNCRRAAMKKLSWLKEPEFWAGSDAERFCQLLDGKPQVQFKAVLSLFFYPVRADSRILRRLCAWIEEGRKREANAEAVSLAGWSAAALGRILTRDMKPGELSRCREQLSAAIEEHNKDAEAARRLQDKLKPYSGLSLSALPFEERAEVMQWDTELGALAESLNSGLGTYLLEKNASPFSYLTFLLRDSQGEVPRFVRQGVIMGIVDWLVRNAGHADVKPLLDSVVAIRADMIRSDDEMSFFEVRVPSDCTPEEYAAVLAEVLRCANPSVSFCDTDKLLDIAVKEVPGCMRMLQACPLRLIDPVNRKTLGFYQFKPYAHAMWVHYREPKGTGKVISRTHEVDDRTRPLSSGLNMKLFMDPYAVIPTIFHEYQHFCGDPNEASVFLKTQLFSIRFYKQYREARAAADDVFTRMTEMLGLPPAPEKTDILNDTIRQYYGEQVGRSAAELRADEELGRLNQYIKAVNARETWDPQVSFPLLNEEGDVANASLIREIVVRYATVPKSITRQEFRTICSQ